MEPKKIVILTPFYNDWISFAQLVLNLDRCVGEYHDVSIFAVDDGSTETLPAGILHLGKIKYIR